MVNAPQSARRFSFRVQECKLAEGVQVIERWGLMRRMALLKFLVRCRISMLSIAIAIMPKLLAFQG
jgi:hypothetical protein